MNTAKFVVFLAIGLLLSRAERWVRLPSLPEGANGTAPLWLKSSSI